MKVAGHSCLNSWKLNRDKESAILLSKTGKFTACNVKFPITHDQVRRLMNLFINGTEERPLFMMLMVASNIVYNDLLSAPLFPP